MSPAALLERGQTLSDKGNAGFKAIWGSARGSNWSQKSAATPGEASRERGSAGYVGDGRRPGSRKRAAFDEAAGRGGPGTSAVGGESNPVNPRAGARQRASEAGSRPWLPVDNAGDKERCWEGSRSRAHRSEQAGLPGEPGTIVHLYRSWKLAVKRSSTRSCSPPRFRPGGLRGSHHHPRKQMEAVIRGPGDPEGARVASRLQTLGRRIFPGG
jgi:hypothetical protein